VTTEEKLRAIQQHALPTIRRFAVRLLNDPADREDFEQDAKMLLLERDGWDPQNPLRLLRKSLRKLAKRIRDGNSFAGGRGNRNFARHHEDFADAEQDADENRNRDAPRNPEASAAARLAVARRYTVLNAAVVALFHKLRPLVRLATLAWAEGGTESEARENLRRLAKERGVSEVTMQRARDEGMVFMKTNLRAQGLDTSTTLEITVPIRDIPNGRKT
jgi:DNA-directed RNA polymerase specialized sigma24 family protein